MKKRILHLITGLEIGGTEMMLLKTLPKMQNNFDNRVCCIKGHGPIGKKLEEREIKIYYLDLKNIFDIKTIFKFRKVVKEFKPDILVTYLIHADLFGRIFGRIFGVKKIICSQRGSLLQWEFLRFFDRLTKFLVTKYIVQTKTARNKLMKKLIAHENKFVIIPNGIDLNDFNFDLDIAKKKNELGINTENINILCVSKLRDKKGHEYLLEAFEKIFETNQKLNLLIVGNGGNKKKLLNQIKAYRSKNNIYFLGERNDVKKILRISDIFVLPTLAEGMSNAILEAMAAGKPIITTDIPENRELIEKNKTGILVPVKDTERLSQAINNLIANPDLAKKLGFRTRQYVNSNYSLEKAISNLSIFFSSF